METVIDLNRSIHIAAGFIGLAAWWIPALTKKGARLHTRFGKAFALMAYIIGGTALASAALRISWGALQGDLLEGLVELGFLVFLAYIGIVVIDLTYYAVRVIRTRREHSTLASPLLSVLGASAAAGSVIVVAYALIFWSTTSIILLLLSPIGIMQWRQQRAYVGTMPTLEKAWFYQHMDAMLGAGVAFHTAFLVFGSQRFLDFSLLGSFNWVPWVLPALVGSIGGAAWKRRYMRQFGDLGDQGTTNPKRALVSRMRGSVSTRS